MLFKQYFLRGFLFKEFRCSLRSECAVRLFRQGWSATCGGMAGRDAQVSAITNKTVTKEQRDLATFWAWSVWVTCLVLKSKCILTVTKLSYIAFTTIMTSTTLISTQISLSCFFFVFCFLWQVLPSGRLVRATKERECHHRVSDLPLFHRPDTLDERLLLFRPKLHRRQHNQSTQRKTSIQYLTGSR